MITTSIKSILNTLNKFWRNISFRKKLILYTSIILYIFILLFGLLIYNNAIRSFNKISEQSNIQRLQSLDEEIKNRLANYSAITSTLLLDINFQEKLEACPSTFADANEYDRELNQYFNALCSSSPIPSDWELYFTYARPTSAYSNIRPIGDAENALWYGQLTSHIRNTITWNLEPESSESPGRFTCAVGISNRKTRSLPAYFKMNINFTNITSVIYTAAEDIDGIFLLCAQDGTLLWCSQPDSSEYLDYILPYSGLSALSPITVSGSLGECSVIALDGEKYGYVLYCIQNSTTPMNNYLGFSRYFLVILSLIIILSLCTLIFSARVVDGRILALTADIKMMDENDLNYHADMTSLDEVGELSRAFSGLIQRIKVLIEHERQFEEERFELEIQALQAQINPHFLFNTLSIINLLAREIEADNISEALEALANFYYFSLNDGKKTTTMRDELTMLDNYLKICSIRYRNHLNIQKDIDPHALDYSIPKLIIQPFCENAVFHGFSPYSKRDPRLDIVVRLACDHLLIVISDNGKGMSEDELKLATETGFAISNVNRRIKMLYGEPYGVSISSMSDEGTKVYIKLGLCPETKNAEDFSLPEKENCREIPNFPRFDKK